MAAPIRIGLLGASRIAPEAVIGPAKADGRFVVSAVAARDPARAAAWAREHGVAAVAKDYAELVGRDDVDVVYNGLPPAGHAKWSIAASQAGKAVLCEKPFAMNAAEAVAIVGAAATAGRPLLEAFHYRFHAVLRKAEALVREGALGRIVSATARFDVTIPRTPTELRWIRSQGGGALMDLGAYPVHALRTLVGEEPSIASAKGVFEDGVDVELSGEFAFPSGATGRIACSMAPAERAAHLTLDGERGRLEIVNFIAPQRGCRFTLTSGGETRRLPTEGPSTYAAQLDHLYDVMTGAAAPLTGGEDAVAQMRTIDALYAAAGRDQGEPGAP